MSIIGTKLKLTIDEPWDAYREIVGCIKQQYIKDNDTYFWIDAISSDEKFVVSSRYVGEDVTDVMQEKVVIVAIYSPDGNIASFNDSDIFSHLKYIAIGSIELNS
jgi:hypothetical protein